MFSSIKNLSFLSKSSTPTERDPLLSENFQRVSYLDAFDKIVIRQGYNLPGDQIHSKILDDLQDFECRTSDILIISYPESGVSGLEDIVVKIVDKLQDKNPSRRKKVAQCAKLEVPQPYGHFRWLKGLKAPRILCSNLPVQLMPIDVQNGVPKIIYFVRNPIDQAIAYYKYHKNKNIFSSFDEFIELFMKGDLLYGDYFNHVIDYWRLSRRYPKDVLFLSYEELKLDIYSMIKIIVDFLDYDLTEQEIIIMLKLSKKIPGIIKYTDDLLKQDNIGKIIGNWHKYFSPEQNRQIDELARTKFESNGLDMTFDTTEAIKRMRKFGRIIIDNKIDDNIKNKTIERRLNTNEKTNTATFNFLMCKQSSNSDEFDKDDKETDEDSEPTDNACSNLLRRFCPCCFKKNIVKFKI